MKPAIPVTTGLVAILLGGVWALQGAGVIGGSPMTGETLWLVVGSVLVVAGIALTAFGALRRSRRPHRDPER